MLRELSAPSKIDHEMQGSTLEVALQRDVKERPWSTKQLRRDRALNHRPRRGADKSSRRSISEKAPGILAETLAISRE